MAISTGQRLGPYEILSAIGAGGMGEVYRARDTRLDRTVAIKILPAHLSSDPARKQRFEREAKTISSLNHPHICVLHDIGHQDGVDYLVMEYVQGETLARRIEKGPLPLDLALKYGAQVADALDRAHRNGIVHRDLKPANIMLTPTGAKLLDFGLAKPAARLTELATLTAKGHGSPVTEDGTILGTFQYMSPEQVEGKEIDGRSDNFSLGAVLYEMLTGQRAFEGKSQLSVASAILEKEPPPISSVKPLTPPLVEHAVKKCLAKLPDERWQSASDLASELKWISESGSQVTPMQAAPVKGAHWRRPIILGPGALLLGALIASFAFWNLKTEPTQQAVSRMAITLPAGQRIAALDQPALAISPDGTNIVYVAVQAGTQQLFLRPLDNLEAKPIAGTEGAVSPFFSAEGQWIGFFAGGKLKKVPVNGGVPMTLTSAPNPLGASWSSRGILALQATAGSSLGLQQVSQEGGTPQPLTRVVKGDLNHGWPEFLPGGNALLFATSATFAAWTNAQIAVQLMGTGERKDLAQAGTEPRYASTGHLLFAQSGTLMAAPFNARRPALTGAAVPVLEGLMQSTTTGAAQYGVSSRGTLVYLAGGIAGSQSRLVWVSRNGEEQPLPTAPHSYQVPRVSPDGRRVAVTIGEQEQQIWVYDTSRDTLTRLTFDGNMNNTATWSPDGKRIAIQSNRGGGGGDLFSQAADGSGGAEPLTTSDYSKASSSFSPDGQLLAFTETTPETGRDIWVLKLADRKAQPFLRTPYEETAPKFSPDGKWLAYSSDESGRREIYVQPYPGPGGKWQISTEGGQEPVWNPHGGELFYRSGSKIMAVEVGTKSGFSAGKPRMLFEGPYLPTPASFPYYDVSPDGQRFLMLKPVESQASAPTQINVVLNWFEELKQKVPTGKK